MAAQVTVGFSVYTDRRFRGQDLSFYRASPSTIRAEASQIAPDNLVSKDGNKHPVLSS